MSIPIDQIPQLQSIYGLNPDWKRVLDELKFQLETNANLQAENKRLRKALEWLKADLKEIKTMNEPTFFTICQRWLPHIEQAFQENPND